VNGFTQWQHLLAALVIGILIGVAVPVVASV
jgi:uncharacterized membrane-anchored protein YhcB (DUF1043 family)